MHLPSSCGVVINRSRGWTCHVAAITQRTFVRSKKQCCEAPVRPLDHEPEAYVHHVSCPIDPFFFDFRTRGTVTPHRTSPTRANPPRTMVTVSHLAAHLPMPLRRPGQAIPLVIPLPICPFINGPPNTTAHARRPRPYAKEAQAQAFSPIPQVASHCYRPVE